MESCSLSSSHHDGLQRKFQFLNDVKTPALNQGKESTEVAERSNVGNNLISS